MLFAFSFLLFTSSASPAIDAVRALAREGRNPEAVTAASAALDGPSCTNPAARIALLNSFGALCAQDGRYMDAARALSSARDLLETNGWLATGRAFATLNNLSVVLKQLGRLAEAEHACTTALAIAKCTQPATTASTSVVRCRANYGEILRAHGRYADAQQIFLSLLGDKKICDTGYLDAVNGLAETLRAQGRFNDARALFEDALAAAGSNGVYAARTRDHARGGLVWSTAFRRAVDAARTVDDVAAARIVADLSCNYAFLCREMGEYDRAEELLGRTIEIRESTLGNDHPDTVAARNDLAIVLQDKGDFARAETLLDETYALTTNRFGPSSIRAATARRNRAILHRAQGEYGAAERAYLDALDTLERLCGTNHPDVAGIQNDCAVLYRMLREYPAAEAAYRRALAARTATLGPDHPLTMQTINNLARLYVAEGSNAVASAILSDIIDRHCFVNPVDEATVLHNIGEAYLAAAKYADATQAFHRALALRTEYLGSNHPAVGTTLMRLAASELAAGKADSAARERLLLLTNPVRRDRPLLLSKAEPRPLSLADRAGRGWQVSDARHHCAIAHAILSASLGPAHHRSIEALSLLARIRAHERDFAVARKTAEQVFLLSEATATTAGGESFASPLRNDQGGLCGAYLSWLEPGTHDAARAFNAIEQARARRFLDASARASAAARAAHPDSDRRRIEQIRWQRTAIEEQLAAHPAADGADADAFIISLQRQAAELRALEQAVESDLSARHPRYGALRSPRVCMLEEAQQLLDNGEAVLELWCGTDRLYGCLIDNERATFASHAVSSGDVARLVAAFRATLDPRAGLGDCDTFKRASLALYRAAVEPFMASFDWKEHSILYIVPDGPLNTVPFEALVSSGRGDEFEDLEYLLLEVPIAYLPSVSCLRFIRTGEAGYSERVTNGLSAVLFGDPAYTVAQAVPAGGAAMRGLKPNPRTAALFPRCGHADAGDALPPLMLEPLPGTRREVEAIASIVNGAGHCECYTGASALERTVKRLSANGDLERCRLVHFATHGLAAGSIAGIVEPGLVLSLYGDDSEDGLLTMSEVLGLRLRADLVTLSACGSGLAARNGNENGIADLSRAFLVAGARRVAVALWDVDDDATIRLMREFYGRFTKPPDAGQAAWALNEAKRALLNGSEFSHPYCWSTFIIHGEWR
ncbi:CHAT domain-containing protein [bacterium]|nr:CHAT domain-containing protein [bacterium]